MNSCKPLAVRCAVWAVAESGLVPNFRPLICSASSRDGSHMAALDPPASVRGLLILPLISKFASSLGTASTLSLTFLETTQQENKENELKEGISTYNEAPTITFFSDGMNFVLLLCRWFDRTSNWQSPACPFLPFRG